MSTPKQRTAVCSPGAVLAYEALSAAAAVGRTLHLCQRRPGVTADEQFHADYAVVADGSYDLTKWRLVLHDRETEGVTHA